MGKKTNFKYTESINLHENEQSNTNYTRMWCGNQTNADRNAIKSMKNAKNAPVTEPHPHGLNRTQLLL